MALTVNGKSQKLTKNDFLTFGSSTGIDIALSAKLMANILAKMPMMFDFIKDSPLPDSSKEGLMSLIDSRTKPFL